MIDPIRDPRGTENVQGAGRGMMMAYESGNTHNMIHVGMGDEDRIDRLDDPFCEMSDLAAVEEQRPLEGADPQEEERIVQQTTEESR